MEKRTTDDANLKEAQITTTDSNNNNPPTTEPVKEAAPEGGAPAAAPYGSVESLRRLSADEPPARPYPKKVFFIVANEFCERFSYYGLRTVLLLYFMDVLHFSDSSAAVAFHLFAALCYLTPVVGAILGDSVLGKFKTILWLSLVYFLGELVLVLASVAWNLSELSVALSLVGLFLIGLGTGGIKPCVSALGGDQFYANETQRRKTFFSTFYAAINVGSLISMFLTPMLRADFRCFERADCYPLAFGLPCALMLASIVVFLMAKNQYRLVPLPEKNVIVAFCQCVWLALSRKLTGAGPRARSQPEPEPEPGSPLSAGGQLNSAHAAAPKKLSPLMDMFAAEPEAVQEQERERDRRVEPRSWLKRGSSVEQLQAPEAAAAGTALAVPVPRERRKRRHWLYLASDRFDTRSIEEFRSVLSILLLFVPIPVYWCLFDQQGSMWTLQAKRMDGRLFGGSFVLQPDQINVANPLLLLASIPLFEMLIYPALNRCNILRRPVQRITAGGLIIALSFVVCALIEVQIEELQPPEVAAPGRANLLLVNGLAGCRLQRPTIGHVAIPDDGQLEANSSLFRAMTKLLALEESRHHLSGQLEPLQSHSLELLSGNHSFLNNYQLKFRIPSEPRAANGTLSACSMAPNSEHQLNIGPFPDQSARLLYLEQGNGKVNHRIFEDSIAMPSPSAASLRLVYEFFGSSNVASRLNFTIVSDYFGDAPQQNVPLARASQVAGKSEQKLVMKHLEGQVLVSGHIELEVPAKGDTFRLALSNYSQLAPNSTAAGRPNSLAQQLSDYRFKLEPGTRNLLVLQQRDPFNLELRHEVVQDNNYRISILWQLIPYLMISMSEVMFSITGLEFSYSLAPETMKSVILGAWSLTTAFGNIITVVLKSLHLFPNMAWDFIFYAIIMTLDMILFAWIGSGYKQTDSK